MAQTIRISQDGSVQEVAVSQGASAQDVPVANEERVQHVGVAQADRVQSLSVAQSDSEQSVRIANGTRFLKGDPGVSPTIDAEAVSGGHNLVITDVDGTEVVFVRDGVTEEIPVSFIEAL